jgi:hypothetical protein
MKNKKKKPACKTEQHRIERGTKIIFNFLFDQCTLMHYIVYLSKIISKYNIYYFLQKDNKRKKKRKKGKRRRRKKRKKN